MRSWGLLQTYFMKILGVFDDHHMWPQNWPHYISLYHVKFFFMNFLYSQTVWSFDTWHINDNTTSKLSFPLSECIQEYILIMIAISFGVTRSTFNRRSCSWYFLGIGLVCWAKEFIECFTEFNLFENFHFVRHCAQCTLEYHSYHLFLPMIEWKRFHDFSTLLKAFGEMIIIVIYSGMTFGSV